MTIYDWFSWLVLNDNESQRMISEWSWCTLLMLQQWQDTQSYTRQIMNSNHSQHDDDHLPSTSRHWQFEGSCLGLSRRTRRRVSWRKWKTWRLESASGKQRTSIYRPLHFCESVQSFFKHNNSRTWHGLATAGAWTVRFLSTFDGWGSLQYNSKQHFLSNPSLWSQNI